MHAPAYTLGRASVESWFDSPAQHLLRQQTPPPSIASSGQLAQVKPCPEAQINLSPLVIEPPVPPIPVPVAPLGLPIIANANQLPRTILRSGQLNRTQASISILELLQASPKHQEVFKKFLADARVPVESTPTDLENVVGIITAPMAISFSDDDLPNGLSGSFSRVHYITAYDNSRRPARGRLIADVQVSAEVQPALTADFENVSFMPSIEVGGQFVPLESMGMAPSTHVSVLDINTPWVTQRCLVISIEELFSYPKCERLRPRKWSRPASASSADQDDCMAAEFFSDAACCDDRPSFGLIGGCSSPPSLLKDNGPASCPLALSPDEPTEAISCCTRLTARGEEQFDLSLFSGYRDLFLSFEDSLTDALVASDSYPWPYSSWPFVPTGWRMNPSWGTSSSLRLSLLSLFILFFFSVAFVLPSFEVLPYVLDVLILCLWVVFYPLFPSYWDFFGLR
ncbi:hypothetical protein SLEP1_g58788 [Rubroshorea leprosula]|uniref:Uncharacterized protein n=1 Tax=Rubroshorea leprosula TaxID=152421 RepID=A0AAV5MSY0_9ROSI|nr:hypothetical protein SLEP1_g58788 [Rubroshorea leprosula]